MHYKIHIPIYVNYEINVQEKEPI